MDARQTAAAIARVRQQEGERPVEARLFEDPLATLFEDADADVQAVFDLMPFFVEHVRLRTRFIDDAVRGAVKEGATRVVLVGAGFDTRVHRMPELRGVSVIEVDHEGQIEEKKRRCEMAGVALPPNLTFAAADLGAEGELARALAKAGLQEPARALWICEGLFGYLSMPTIAELALEAARLSGPGSRLIGNHNVHSWSTAALTTTFESAGWRAGSGPSFEELHVRWIGSAVPAGWEMFAMLVAGRD